MNAIGRRERCRRGALAEVLLFGQQDVENPTRVTPAKIRRPGAGRLFLAARLVVLPHCVTRQESFVLLCQLAQSGEQLPRLGLEARQLPQTRKDKFGWPFHDLVYGRFLMPRCDVKHTTTQPVRSVASANG